MDTKRDYLHQLISIKYFYVTIRFTKFIAT